MNVSQVQELSVLSEDELTNLIEAATQRRETLRNSRKREAEIGPQGSKGQDVRNPDHGVVPVPTPSEVKAVGPAHGVDGTPQKAMP